MSKEQAEDNIEYVSRYKLPKRQVPPLIGFVTDCADDFALTKVELAKYSAFGSSWQYLPTVTIDSFSTDTLGVNGAVLAQYLVQYSNENKVPTGLILNSAPRIKGEGLIGGEILIVEIDDTLPVLLTNGPGVLEHLQNNITKAFKVETDLMVEYGVLSPTQFRSFQWFSELLSKFIYQDSALETTPIEDITPYILPSTKDDFAWLIDSFGNVKLTLTESKLNRLGINDGDIVTFNIAGREVSAIKREKLFPLPSKTSGTHIGLYKGSDTAFGEHFYELAIAYDSVANYIEHLAPLIEPGSKREHFSTGSSIKIESIARTQDRVEEQDGSIRPISSNGALVDALSKGQTALKSIIERIIQ